MTAERRQPRLAPTPLLDEARLAAGVSRVANEITAHYGQRPIVIVGVLTGSIVFLSDLIRRLRMPLQIAFIQASSYRGDATRPGQLVIKEDLLPPLSGADVLVLDDIFDTGHTLVTVRDRLRALGAASVKTAVLLRKLGRQEVDALPDYVAFDIPDEFVVGYGLDFDNQYRHLPYVGVLVWEG